ncbi:PRD domain-containing protein [Breznakia pachnodae]|uniref:Beta-glucoside operon transcriptional antiterminator n=1 Tax=Breznakia pachnodae TaxID=265178 RepID=A0ABU0E7X2_9FIRM|nr:PRD domain-containing protein [Breznakia pachnodae]MDQ0363002.1 beta-glucoside operon transcriptional antiterminator [Breznakia pachnodae]
MIIVQLLNNNVIIARDKKREIIVMGTGLGYKARVGDKVDESKIQKTFMMKEFNAKLIDLVEEIPAVYLEITEMIVEYGEELGLKFSNSVYLILTDHIYHAIIHEKEGIILKNSFFSEMKRYYPTEFAVARQAKKIILDRIGFEISEDELGFIVLHIIETSSGQKTKEVEREVKFVNDSIEYIKSHNENENLVENTINFDRLVVHLKYIAKRYFKNDEVIPEEALRNEEEDSLLNQTIETCLPGELAFARKYGNYIEELYGENLSRQELNYLSLHFRNVNVK